MPKKTFNAENTAAAELFNTPTQPAQATPTAKPAASKKKAPAQTQAPAADDFSISWKAKPDGEPRTRRIQIVCKPSIAMKAAKMSREQGISVAYLFELLVSAEWDKRQGGK